MAAINNNFDVIAMISECPAPEKHHSYSRINGVRSYVKQQTQ
jgi:hypothetical protein